MAAPQLRLLWSACLRGLIQPDYPNGRQSRVRELLICQSIDREQQGAALLAAANANLHLLNAMAIRGGNVAPLHQEAMRLLAIGHDLLQHYPQTTIEESLRNTVDTAPLQKMADLFAGLKAAGIKDKLPVE